MSTFFSRLRGLLLFVVVGFLVFVFPGGVITLAAACHDSAKIDGWDWIFSIFVPFYGAIEAFVC
jgi:hypothetical protein